MTSITQWLSQHTVLLGSVATGSVLLLLVSILATPWIVAQLPDDALLQRYQGQHRSRLLRLIWKSLRTLIGFALILLGLIMIVAPGPGLLTVLAGISLASFPGKRRLLRHVASRESVFNSMNWMRKRYDKPPLLHPSHDDH